MCLDQITDVPLVKPADTTYNYGLGVPRRTRNASNYYVDVLFTPTAPAPVPPPRHRLVVQSGSVRRSRVRRHWRQLLRPLVLRDLA
jgi:hypothetical protein